MKNILKSVFITAFPSFAVIVLVESVYQLYKLGLSFSSIGNLISALAIVIFFAGLFLKPQARTSRNLSVFTLIIVSGFLVTLLISLINNFSFTVLTISFALLVCWILYLKWYSVFEERETTLLKIGNQLPTFKVEDISNNIISSEIFKGKPAIYLFYRGNWCPLCMAQIKEIAAQYKELEKRGVTMNFISPQPHSYSNILAEKFNLGFNFLTDTDNKVAKQLGIFSENGIPAGFQVFGYDSDTVLPTVIITDVSGKIIFLDETDNYRVRPEPETFLRVLDEMYFSQSK